ncbi:MAG: long-chain acyl-CoA synthetase, partial [Actinomycetota bacterium]|nr:long-chain acyl-CoA synthetase [Actinomycetota bacterium]
MTSKTAESSTERPRALDASTMVEAFQLTAEDHADHLAIRTKAGEVEITWSEYAERVQRLAGGLSGIGLERGQTMALMLTNRPEFHVFDAAAMHLGAIPYSIYNTYAPEQIEHQIGDAESAILVTEKAFLDQVLDVRGRADGLEQIIVVDGDGSDDTLTIEDVESAASEDFDFEQTWRSVEPDDLLTLIYTSGTTGDPKGVELRHSGITQALRSADEVIGFPVAGRVVSWLPMAHVAERACGHYIPMGFGLTTTCCPDPAEVAEYLPEVRPSWFFSPPRLWEKLKASIEASLEDEEDDEKRQATEQALEVGRERMRLVQSGEEVPDDLQDKWDKADEQVLSKIRERLGFDVAVAVNVAAAPCPDEVIEFFHAIGVPLADMWGLSEHSGLATCNPPDRIKIGT